MCRWDPTICLIQAKYWFLWGLFNGRWSKWPNLHESYRQANESSAREVSPQLLIHHRGNWYLGAWCHQQEAMRSFAMDAIEQASVLSKSSKAMPKKALDGFVGQGYGIFSGSEVQWATLRFTEERARWVSRELWHPLQRLTPQEGLSVRFVRKVATSPFSEVIRLGSNGV